jgi:hypothetical protein
MESRKSQLLRHQNYLSACALEYASRPECPERLSYRYHDSTVLRERSQRHKYRSLYVAIMKYWQATSNHREYVNHIE